MRRTVLAYVLGFVSALTFSAAAADRASDWILEIDRPTAGAPILRRLSYAQHVDIPNADWAGMRGAAAQSLAALDGWMNQKGWGVWWLSFPVVEREAARQAILLGQ